MRGHPTLIGIFNSRTRPPAANAADIHDALLDAIVVQDLPPGTKLGEEMLVEIFNLGRRHVSAALDQLSWEGLVERRPNRGACVAAPSAAEAREIFGARHAIEGGIVRTLVRAVPQADYTTVQADMAQERSARANGQLREAIRLSGGFHVALAAMAGNTIMASQVKLLVARTSLLVALYERPDALTCWHDDHIGLIELIQAKRESDAVELMQRHLQELLDALDLSRQAPLGFDARSAFQRGR